MALTLLTESSYIQQDIELHFKAVDFIKGYDEALQLSIAVPKSWGVIEGKPQVATAENPLALIARLRANASDNADISVWCAYLVRELHPADWLEAWTQSQNYQVLDKRTVPSAFGTVADILATRDFNGKSYTCRLTAIKDAERIFLLVAKIHANDAAEFNQAQEDFLIAVQTFKLLQPTKLKYAEAFEWVSMALPQPIQFILPHSWHRTFQTEVPEGGQGILVENKLQDLTLGSLFIVTGAPDYQEPDAVEQVLVQKINNNGFELIEDSYQILNEGAANPQVTFVTAQRLAIKADEETKKNMEYVISSARFHTEKAMILFVLLSPSKTAHFEAWAINRRVFELAFNEMKM